jgi:serine/threonine protein kinase
MKERTTLLTKLFILPKPLNTCVSEYDFTAPLIQTYQSPAPQVSYESLNRFVNLLVLFDFVCFPMDTPTISGYEILEEIGRGGMGVVYKATRLDSNQVVALKLIRSGGFASPQERDRMRIEAEAMSRLLHPNIVRIFEFGEVSDLPYLAMEYISAVSLDRYVAQQPLSIDAAIQLIKILALAIGHAHDQKIVHRDIKPANILIRTSDIVDASACDGSSPNTTFISDRQQFITAVITDFGLAKRLDSQTTAWTQFGNILGSASYMAPEQAAGSSSIGPAADIYALGTILYELLAGRPPFRFENWTETIRHVINEDPPQFESWNIDIPADLQAICFKCLEKQPADRYASASALAGDLDLFLRGQPISIATLSDDELVARYAAKDGYAISAVIAIGPRAKVYRAAFGPLQVPVALKVFERDVCSSADWDSKVQEGARLTSTIDHPHVVIPKQMGWWNGFPYVACEYSASGNLQDAIADRKFSVEEALRIVDQLTEIVCYLHRQGIVHGNLKPSNIMIAADGNSRVTDMRWISGLSFGPLSNSHAWKDLAFVPPELLDPAHDALRPVTDIYALGAILYTLLSGRAPFEADSMESLVDKVQNTDPASIASFNGLVTAHLDAFTRRCLRKSPWWRYARAYDMLLRIREFRQQLDPQSRPRKS